MRLSRELPPPLAPDLAAAAVLAGWALLETRHAQASEAAAALLATAPLAWRRSAPLTSATLVALGFALTGAPAHPVEPLATLVALLVAAFSVAAGAGLPGLAVVLAGAAAES